MAPSTILHRALIIVAGLIAVGIPLPFAAFNITTRAIDLPHGYSLALVDSDVMLAMPDHSFQTVPFPTVYIGVIAMTLVGLAVVYARRRKRPARGFDVQPPDKMPQ